MQILYKKHKRPSQMLKNILVFFLLLNILACNESKPVTEVKAMCKNATSFGNFNLCLPELAEYEECYAIEKVRIVADSFEIDENQILGYYLPDTIYNRLDSLYQLSYDNYFKFYTNKALKDQKITRQDFEGVVNLIQEDFVLEQWDQIEDKTLEKFQDMPFNKPQSVKNYNLDQNAHVLIMMINYENNDYPMLSFLNTLYVKDKLLWMAYYKNYKSENSIREGKSQNDRIVKAFLDLNQ